jgi:hypothetical protein
MIQDRCRSFGAFARQDSFETLLSREFGHCPLNLFVLESWA